MGKGMPAGHMREKIAEPLNILSHGFSLFLDRREELVHGHLDVILVESTEEPSFQVNPRIDGVHMETPKPVKSYPLRVSMNSLVMMASLSITILV